MYIEWIVFEVNCRDTKKLDAFAGIVRGLRVHVTPIAHTALVKQSWKMSRGHRKEAIL